MSGRCGIFSQITLSEQINAINQMIANADR